MRTAQRAVRDHVQITPAGEKLTPYRHPFYWATFCLLGAPEVKNSEV
ncbi:MAG: hypothetical protein JXA33_05445 [Anaerolineae bacterium]|nr:hypothetical protein [Anaerolineae bacterium]